MTLEELSIKFTADAQPLADKLSALGGLMQTATKQASALEGAFHTCGSQAGAGLARGILSKKSAVVSAANAVAQAASNALKNALQIHSPSKVTMDFGKRFGEGFSGGILSGEKDAAGAAKALSLSAVHALPLSQTGGLPLDADGQESQTRVLSMVEAALKNISITVPLQVDGYRLGVAAAKGLNALRAATGRDALI